MKIKTALSFVVLIAFLVTFTASVQGQKGLTGRVTGQSGDTKEYAGVTIIGPGKYSVMTDPKGEFSLPNFKGGRYTVTVRQGNNLQKFIVDIDATGRLDLKVKW
jgi:hypothetical protein